MNRKLASALACGVCIVAMAAPASAQTRTYSIPAGSLKSALDSYNRQSGRPIIYKADQVRGAHSGGANGVMSAEAALTAILAGTSFRSQADSSGAVAIVRLGNGGTAVDAQTASSSGGVSPAAGEVGDIIVTGTNIKGVAPVGTQLVVVDRSAIEKQGFGTIQDVLTSLPQVNQLGAQDFSQAARNLFGLNGNANRNLSGGVGINLRGLGPDATLLLLNGRRVAPAGTGTFGDISQIPLIAVERAEVLVDGASAIYGSDAVGGVVNVITRRTFKGFEATARYDHRDGEDSYQVGAIAGTSWGSGRVMAAYQYREHGNLSVNDRPYITDDLRRFGGRNLATPNGGTLTVAGQTFGLPPNQDGRQLRATDLLPGVTNFISLSDGADILPRQADHALVASVQQTVSDKLSIWADGNLNIRTIREIFQPENLTLTIPNTNAFFVTPVAGATSVRVANNFGVFINQRRDVAFQVATGLDWQLSDRWSLSAYYSHGEDTLHSVQSGFLNTALLAPFLASGDPATAFNAFGTPSVNNPATLAAVAGYTSKDLGSTLDIFNVTINGTLFSLPGGEVRFAGGYEHKADNITVRSTSFTSSLVPSNGTPTDISRHSDAVFGELNIPLVGESNALPFVRSLDVSIAGRVENYSDFGRTSNPRVGVNWKPVDDLSIHASYGTSFKAPLLFQLTGAAGVQLFNSFAISGPTGLVQAIFNQGPPTNLQPETAKIVTVGGDFKPSAVPGLVLKLDYFHVDYANRINIPDTSTVLLNPGYAKYVTLNPTAAQVQAIYSSGFFRGSQLPPAQIGAIVDLRYTNLSQVHVRGFDFSGNYDFAVGLGRLSVGASGTLFLDYSNKVSPGTPFVNVANTPYNVPKFKGRLSVLYSAHWGSAGVFVNYVNSYNNNLVTPVEKVDAWTTADASITWNVGGDETKGALRDFSVSINATNLFDKAPPYLNSNRGYDPGNANALGRSVGVQLRKRF